MTEVDLCVFWKAYLIPPKVVLEVPGPGIHMVDADRLVTRGGTLPTNVPKWLAAAFLQPCEGHSRFPAHRNLPPMPGF